MTTVISINHIGCRIKVPRHLNLQLLLTLLVKPVLHTLIYDNKSEQKRKYIRNRCSTSVQVHCGEFQR